MGKPAIDKMKPEEVLSMTRLYFIGGCFFLPWLWLVNFMHVWPSTRRRKDLPSSVTTYVYLSLGGAIFWTIVIVIWMSVYFTQRNKWGEFGDRISISLPKGQ
ncbi:gamma-secretase aspartyl protease complex, presenilin enhancer-2 subunit [Chytridium lagenaria]|nr:gamma-secretase aspartyl protease complex, presenilin enhancer-2 subunit [Chytridium lagenaria]